MKLYYFGEHSVGDVYTVPSGSDFAILAANSKEEAIEKFKIAREKEIQRMCKKGIFDSEWRDVGGPFTYSGLEDHCEEIPGDVYFDNHG